MSAPDRALVVTSVLEQDAGVALRALRAAHARSKLVEIRADRLHADDVERLVRECGRPAIVTIRREGDGGAYDGSEEERRRTLERALRAGAAFVDVEHASALRDLAEGPDRRRVILSAHGGPCRADELAARYREMARSGAARIKLVPAATSLGDVVVVRETLRAAAGGTPLACFATGAAGRATRILALAWGSWATYGSVEEGRETGAGQITAVDLIDVYDAPAISSDYQMQALVGGDVGLSPSPAMHAAGFRSLGMKGVYLPLDAASFDEAEALAAPAALGLTGLAVTMPFKEAAAAASEPSDDCARAARAVNTVRIEGTRKLGFNTDGPAIAELAAARVPLQGARIAITGAGGTARAAAASLLSAGASVRIFARDSARAAAVAAELGGDSAPWAGLADDPWQVLIQATPLGRAGESILPARALERRTFILDAVYGTETTPLVRDARRAGIAVADGIDLLAAQAVRQFEILNGKRPSPTLFLEVARKRVALPSM